jgi:hypothetical protein
VFSRSDNSIRRQLLPGIVVAVFVVALTATGATGRSALVIGTVAGSGYGLIALGLVLIYKSSGIFNFAQGEFGTVAVYALWGALGFGLPYPVAVLLALGVACALGVMTERVIVRRLLQAPRGRSSPGAGGPSGVVPLLADRWSYHWRNPRSHDWRKDGPMPLAEPAPDGPMSLAGDTYAWVFSGRQGFVASKSVDLRST